ncbi:hypothetical protein BOTBODRAFT_69600 [Botryobasidium botryosum FD-172 SS1]|uniref:Uncharacterized protein n=1 Tax=Botryobasidium botryosum (strain FD-172 SS1) TaxID=930990 RepID=A0A067MB29_BOTB1|nr:hypothetical protein BOTBODRAFT_69600 [Botryobasidium botryosum FD-172 SS1]
MWNLHPSSSDHWISIASIAAFKTMQKFQILGFKWLANALGRSGGLLEVDNHGESEEKHRSTVSRRLYHPRERLWARVGRPSGSDRSSSVNWPSLTLHGMGTPLSRLSEPHPHNCVMRIPYVKMTGIPPNRQEIIGFPSPVTDNNLDIVRALVPALAGRP